MPQLLTKATSDYELITTWLLDKQSPLSQKQYQTSIGQFIRYIGCPLCEVKVEDLQGYVRMLEMKGNKPSTIKGKLSVVKSLFSFAFSVGYITSNVAVLVKPPKVHKRTASMRIDHDDIRKMVDGARSDRDH